LRRKRDLKGRESLALNQSIATAAFPQRAKIALVKTPDLFGPAKYLRENPSDIEYAHMCRKAIFHAEGEVVIFPPVPTSEASVAPELREVPDQGR
jgi:hypothetical protein